MCPLFISVQVCDLINQQACGSVPQAGKKNILFSTSDHSVDKIKFYKLMLGNVCTIIFLNGEYQKVYTLYRHSTYLYKQANAWRRSIVVVV